MSHIDDVIAFVIEEFLPDVSPGDLPPTHDLLAGGVIDSLGLLKLFAWLEDRFGITVDDTAMNPENFRSVAAIDQFITDARQHAVTGG